AWEEPVRTATIATHRRAFPSGAVHFLATIDGAPVGVGSIELRDGIATLVGGGVVPAWRGAHLHRWLIAERLAEAARRGATEVLATAEPNSTSLRNLVACGLRPVWVEEVWETRSR
ncbi:MAG: GNAT family N-acetyltransferase, partial [Armatimonadota bacterium]